jgi:hypothetical protein
MILCGIGLSSSTATFRYWVGPAVNFGQRVESRWIAQVITRRFTRCQRRLAGTGVRLRFPVAPDEHRPRRDQYSQPCEVTREGWSLRARNR